MSIRSGSPGQDADDTKTQLKRAALALFARHGMDAVTVQQIVAAAGQRNNAALHYHFGSKEDLVRQLLIEGAQQIDNRRQEMLAAIDKAGGPSSVRQVLEVLVTPVIELEADKRRRGYIRLVAGIQMTDRELLRSALAGRWNAGYVRCLDLLKELVKKVPPELLEQRLSLLGIYSNAVLSARDAALDNKKSSQRLWREPYSVANMMDTLEAVVTCRPSDEALTKLGRPQKPG
jgi:AcrR family transcriptional regulator